MFPLEISCWLKPWNPSLRKVLFKKISHFRFESLLDFPLYDITTNIFGIRQKNYLKISEKSTYWFSPKINFKYEKTPSKTSEIIFPSWLAIYKSLSPPPFSKMTLIQYMKPKITRPNWSNHNDYIISTLNMKIRGNTVNKNSLVLRLRFFKKTNVIKSVVSLENLLSRFVKNDEIFIAEGGIRKVFDVDWKGFRTEFFVHNVNA